MAAILKSTASLGEMKLVATLILLVLGVAFILGKQPPKRIREMDITPGEKKKLKNSVGLLVLLAALLYPVERLLATMIDSGDFLELFWGGGLIVIAVILMLLINYYQKK